MSNVPEELKDFFTSLEEISTINIWKIQKQLNACGVIPEAWKHKIAIERKALFCSLNGGELIEHFSTTDLQGENSNSLVFSQSELDYLEERVNFTKNFWLKARYSNLLWVQLKHNKFAKTAIENYLLCFDKIDPSEFRDFDSLLDACLYLSKKTSIHLKEVKEIIQEMYHLVPVWYKAHLVESILKNQIFCNDELKIFAEDSINWFEKDKSYSSNKYSLECAIQLRNKVGLPTKICYELFADNEELILREHKNDDNFVKYTTVGNQIRFLKKSGQPRET